MKRSKTNLLFTVWLIVLFFVCFVVNAVFALQMEDETWSFDFKNCSISDALNQISVATGISIYTNGQRKITRFSKSYNGQTIDLILRDLFRKQSCAMVWSYGESGLVAIGIWVFEGGESRGGFDPGSFIKYKATNAKSNLTNKNVEISKDLMAGGNSSDHRKYASFDGRTKKSKQQSEKSVRAPGSRISGGGGLRRSRVFNESVSNQGDYRETFAPPSPLQKVDNQGAGAPDGVTNDVEQQDSTSGPPAPPAEISHGLEPPPMPPGFSYKD